MIDDAPGAAAELTVGVGWLRLLVDALTATGFDARGHCRRAGWGLEADEDVQARVPWTAVIGLWDAAARSSGDPHLGLHVAMSLPFRAESPFGYAVAASPTLLDALSLMVRYQALHFDGGGLSLDDRGDSTALVIRLPAGVPTTSHQIEYIATVVKRTCAWIVGARFALAGVRFRHGGPANAEEHERVFECPVEFGQAENALLFTREVTSRRSLYANAEVFGAVQAIAERRLSALRTSPWVRRVRDAVGADPALRARITDVAQRLGVSRRSLQRMLTAENSTFAGVLDQSRRERALELIDRKEMTVAGIAAQVGFADPRAFVRAFRRWTGASPTAYRAAREADR